MIIILIPRDYGECQHGVCNVIIPACKTIFLLYGRIFVDFYYSYRVHDLPRGGGDGNGDVVIYAAYVVLAACWCDRHFFNACDIIFLSRNR